MYINVWMKMNAMLFLLCDWKKPMSNAHNKGMKIISLEHSQFRNNEQKDFMCPSTAILQLLHRRQYYCYILFTRSRLYMTDSSSL